MNRSQRESLERIIGHVGAGLVRCDQRQDLWDDLDRLRPMLQPRARRQLDLSPKENQTAIEELIAPA